MTLIRFAWVGVTAVGMIISPLVLAQQAEPPAIEPQQNDQRAAIARIDPQKPIQIRVVSRSNLPVIASLGATIGDRPVAPGKSVTFGRLHTSYLPLPLDLQVTLKDTPDPNNPLGVFLNIKTVGNEVVVEVKTAFSSQGNSSQTVTIDPKGAVYRF